MDWANERYVRLYTRDTTTWKLLGWQGQTVLMLMMRKLDRSGRLPLDGLEPNELVQLHTGLPAEVGDAGAAACLRRKVFVVDGDELFMPNYRDAQESQASAAERQRRYRERVQEGLDGDDCDGTVYFVQSPATGHIKIGVTRDVTARLAALQTIVPGGVELVLTVGGGVQMERELHAKFRNARRNGEWFERNGDVEDFIRDALSRNGANKKRNTATGVTPSLAVPSLAQPSLALLSDTDAPPTAAVPIGSAKHDSDARQVFEHWVATHGKPASVRFTPQRKAKIRSRLRDGYDIEQLCRAIDGCKLSAFHMGENDRGQPYNDLETILKSGKTVEEHIARVSGTGSRPRVDRQQGAAYQPAPLLEDRPGDGELPPVRSLPKPRSAT
jgi:hypothetical protein